MSRLYESYRDRFVGAAPKDESEFKQFINDIGGPTIKKYGYESADALLAAGRDDLPLVVKYRQDKPVQGVIAHEQTGLDGQRIVAFLGGKIELVDDQRFATLTQPAP